MIQKYATLIAFSQIVLNFDKNRQKIDFSESYRFPGLNGEIDLASLLSATKMVYCHTPPFQSSKFLGKVSPESLDLEYHASTVELALIGLIGNKAKVRNFASLNTVHLLEGQTL